MKTLLIHPRYENEEQTTITQLNMKDFLDSDDEILSINISSDLSTLSEITKVLEEAEFVIFNYDYEDCKVNQLIKNICEVYDKPFEILNDYRIDKLQKAIEYIKDENFKRILVACYLRILNEKNISLNNTIFSNLSNIQPALMKRYLNPMVDYSKLKQYIKNDYINIQEVLDDLKIPVKGLLIKWQVTDNTFNVICDKQYNSLDKTVKTIINKHCKKLEKQLQGQDINKIFNNPSIIYKIYDDSFFAYKISGTYQIRLLFKYIDTLELHKIYIKNGNHNTFNDEYLEIFQNYIDKII